MWKIILSMIPWQVVLPWVLSKLTGLSEKAIEKALDIAFDRVVEVERKYGDGNGLLKAEEVKRSLQGILTDASAWVLNLLVEVAVAKAKKAGTIQ